MNTKNGEHIMLGAIVGALLGFLANRLVGQTGST